MGSSCPECGSATGFVEETARVRRGTCGACGRAFTILEEGAGSAATAGETGPAAEEGTTPAPAATTPAAGPACGVCGAALALRPTSETSFEAKCRSCSTTFTYVLSTAPFPAGPRSFAARRRPPRDDTRGAGPPRSRPCRECGGPLQFSTDAEGNVTGECSSCGNRFTLPPRREFGDRGDRRGPGRRFSPSSRGPRGWSGGPGRERPRRFGRPSGPYRRSERSEETEEEGRDRRRRRRPRDD